MSAPTPGPWAAIRGGEYIVPADHAERRIGGAVGVAIDRDEFAQIIARVQSDHHGRGDREANAALIVRAVNSHDDLVAALRALIAATLNPGAMKANLLEALANARAVIEKATS